MKKLTIITFALLAVFLSGIAINCGDPVQPPVNPPPPPAGEPDSTTQNFTFQTYEFGDGFSSSYLNDVWIFNENNIWACGYINVTSNSGRVNFIHWNGKQWLGVAQQFDSGGFDGIWAADSNDIYFADGIVLRYSNGVFKYEDFSNIQYLNGQGVHKLWGSSTSNIWGVGPWGTIVHYDGSQWTKIDFDQQWYFYGITGNPETGIAYATARTPAGTVIVVTLDNNSANIIFNNQDSSTYDSYFIHFRNNKLWLAGNYIWTIDINTKAVKEETYLGGYGISAISSASPIDMYYFGGEVPDIGRMVHYNGKRYTAFTLTPLSDSYGGGFAIKDLAVRCGSANNKGFITIIKRIKQ